ncbi:hypothetical protein [Microvirga ossetica]|nr:hypothetical protein [Microvirga ossetica]
MAGDVDQMVSKVVSELQKKADSLSSYEPGVGRYLISQENGRFVIGMNPVGNMRKTQPLASGDPVQISRWIDTDKVKRDGYNRMREAAMPDRDRIKQETAASLAEMKASWTIEDGGTLRPEATPDPFVARSERTKKDPMIQRAPRGLGEPRSPREPRNVSAPKSPGM